MHIALEQSVPDLIRIPPFRDAHMHFMIDGRPATIEKLAQMRDRYRKCGVYSVEDMGHKDGIGLVAKSILSDGFTVMTAGWALYRRGGYGGFIGKAVSGNDEIRRGVADLADSGADYIKVINSGIVGTRRDEPVATGGFSREELKVLCGEAAERGLRVVCHANSDELVRRAVLAGVSSIEHGFLVSRETLLMMAEAGVSWTPTVVGLRSIIPSLGKDERKYVEEVLERHLVAISEASAAGVILKIGTDGGAKGVPHGASFIEELRQFQNAGLSVEKILAAASMPTEDAEEGTFLLVKREFITSGKIEAVYEHGVRVNF